MKRTKLLYQCDPAKAVSCCNPFCDVDHCKGYGCNATFRREWAALDKRQEPIVLSRVES